MAKYIGKRLLQLIPILIGITFLSFALLSIAPGDPAQRKLTAQGITVSREVLVKARKDMGLDRPFLVRYTEWFMQLLRGDLGNSYKDNLPVASKLTKGMKYTLMLMTSSMVLSLLVSIPLAVYTAVQKDRFLDYFLRFISFIGNAMPNFLISVMLMYILCIKFKLFPVIAQDSLKGLPLPTLALSIPLISRFLRQFRAEILIQTGKDYVIGARARGIKSYRILFFNILYNSMPSIITITGLSVGTLMGGSVVVEAIFLWPGVGRLVMDSISARDYPVIQGFVLVMSVIYVGIHFVADISYRWFNPRVKA